jgi:hypothetical protein
VIDLEDVQRLDQLKDPLVAEVFFKYNPRDYLHVITGLN